MKQSGDMLILHENDFVDERRATREFNRAVRNTRIASYFDKAISRLFPDERRDTPVFHYIVPGSKPKDDIEHWIYDSILNQIKLRDQEMCLEESIRILWSLLLAQESSREEGSNHVREREESTV